MRTVFSKPLDLAYFLYDFALVHPLHNLRKCAIYVSLPNLPWLGLAGTFGCAVCAKRFSEDCTLRV